MPIFSLLSGDSLMKPKFADSPSLDRPLFADGVSGHSLHSDQFDTQAPDGFRPQRKAGNKDSDATSRPRLSRMLKKSKAAKNPQEAERMRKKGADQPARGQ